MILILLITSFVYVANIDNIRGRDLNLIERICTVSRIQSIYFPSIFIFKTAQTIYYKRTIY